MKRWPALVLMAAVAAASLFGADRTVILATTTSTQDSGLLDVLVPQFQKKTGIQVKTIAVGSGQAMAMGRRGEADVLLVHSPDAEKTFMAEGHGLRRRLVMHNDFILLGTEAQKAALGGRPVAEALRKAAAAAAPFASRADQSGTHAMELKLWKAAGVVPAGQPWYLETGSGMGATLNVAAEKKAVVLSDRATWLALRKTVGMVILCEGDASLLNVYHVIELDPARHPRIQAEAGKAFADFMVGPEAQEAIRTFGVDRYGSPLFFPDAGKKDE